MMSIIATGGVGPRVAAVMVLAAALTAAAVSPAAPAKKEALGTVKVTIEVEGGKDFKNAVLYAGDRAVKLGKKEKSKTVNDLKAREYAVTIDARVKEGWFGPEKRYLGVSRATVIPGKTAEVAVKLKPVALIDDFCGACHPDADQPVERGQIRRDAHYSGVMLDDRNLAQIRKFNEKIKKSATYDMPNVLPMRIEERMVKVDGKDASRTFMNCESCHTPHFDVGPESYARAHFKEKSDLCVGCHY